MHDARIASGGRLGTKPRPALLTLYTSPRYFI